MPAGMGWLAANLLFFMPRRPVEITLEMADRNRMPEPRREVLNLWLEKWYNGDLAGAEKPVWVPYHFLFGRRSYGFPPAMASSPDLDAGLVRPETRVPALVERCKQQAPQAMIVEGYGMTECSPVVSVNPPSAPKRGSIGKPLPGVAVRIVDLESGAAVLAGQMGMIHVSGPTVFPGYLGHDGPSPFVEDEGKRWYVTGDLGEQDEDGYLWFRGRLKRFLKAGGAEAFTSWEPHP